MVVDELCPTIAPRRSTVVHGVALPEEGDPSLGYFERVRKVAEPTVFTLPVLARADTM